MSVGELTSLIKGTLRQAPRYAWLALGGADLAERPARAEQEIVDIFFSTEEERTALRVFLRALRRLPAHLPWHATIWSRTPGELAAPLELRVASPGKSPVSFDFTKSLFFLSLTVVGGITSVLAASAVLCAPGFSVGAPLSDSGGCISTIPTAGPRPGSPSTTATAPSPMPRRACVSPRG